MGREKLPDNIKKARGTLQKCRASGSDGLFTLDKVKVPKWLTKEARKIFVEKTNYLIAYNILTPLDIDNMAIYANSMSEVINANNELQIVGRVLTVKTKFGSITHPSPYIKIMNDNIKIVNTIGQQYGFSPSSRSSIMNNVAKDEEKDEFTDFDEVK